MTYKGVVITDVSLDNQKYHNATVTMIFEGDSADIKEPRDSNGNVIPSSWCTKPSQTGWFWILSKGSATVTIESGDKLHIAHLAPDQVFVALDQCNGGIGFGSMWPSGVEPAYPLAFTLGTAEEMTFVEGLRNLNQLKNPVSVTGVAWSCVGYPPTGAAQLQGTQDGRCTNPDNFPLNTDVGKLIMYQPYESYYVDGSLQDNHNGSLNHGTFSVRARRD